MACPKCGCKVSYQYDDGDDDLPDDERIERCAACGHIFDIEDELPEDDEYQSDVQAAAGGLTQVPIE